MIAVRKYFGFHDRHQSILTKTRSSHYVVQVIIIASYSIIVACKKLHVVRVRLFTFLAQPLTALNPADIYSFVETPNAPQCMESTMAVFFWAVSGYSGVLDE